MEVTASASEDGGLLLSAEDLVKLRPALSQAQRKWYELGTRLGFSSAVLHEIEKGIQTMSPAGEGASFFMSAMLDGWMRTADPPYPTWSHLIRCLRDVEECEAAKAVEELAPKVDDKETQKAIITPLLNQPLQKGDTWYLVHSEWFKNWKRFVNFDYYSYSTPDPGPINTADLLKDDQLKDFMMENSDFALLPQAAWEKLVSWHGLSQGSIPIPRKVVEFGLHVKELKVEIYLIDLYLCWEDEKPEETVTKTLSRSTTVGELEALMRDIFRVPKDIPCTVRSFYRDLVKPDDTLGELSIHSREKIVLRRKSTSDSSPESTPESTPPEPRTSRDSEASNLPKQSDIGLCGLNNLGNTCFMNSALQCLSNTEPLRAYFLAVDPVSRQKLFEKALNTKNPLGSGGALAVAFSKLMEEMWRGGKSAVAPRQLKSEIGDFAPQFSGYGQQDSQELLAFLLDGLHEDTNLVLKKPYVDMNMKTEGRSDKEIADETWEKYLMRNKSFIVDLFQGQYKSTVTCPQCHMVSKTFDPFMYLSLSVPMNSEMLVLSVTVVRADPSTPVCKYKVKVMKQGTISDLKVEVQNVTKINQCMMMAVGIEKSVIEKIFDDGFILTDLGDKEDVYIYELTHPVDDPNYVPVPVQHYEERVMPVKYAYKEYQKQEFISFGFPLMIEVPKAECTFANLYSMIESQCRFIKSYNVAATDRQDPEDNQTETVLGPTEKNQSRQPVEMRNVVETRSGGSRERPACLFRLDVGNRKGKKTKQEQLSENGKAVVLNRTSFVACIWKPQVKNDYYDNEQAMRRDECAGPGAASGQRDCELVDCFKSFSTSRLLSEDNKWNCPKCKKVRASKKFEIWKWPKILIVHFKRFSYGRYRRSKIEGLIKFPINDCDLSEFNINPEEPSPVYDLFAVSNHFGGMGGGHYTAYAKNSNTGNWYLFNDSHVEHMPENRIVSSAAYVLFYCHKSKESPSPRGLFKESSV